MFAPPKTTDFSSGAPLAPEEKIPPTENVPGGSTIPPVEIEENLDEMIKVEDTANTQIPVSDNPLKNQKTETKVDKPIPSVPENETIQKERNPEVAKIKEPPVYIGCRVSNQMKADLEDMAKDFAYLARKKYGLKIKDDSSSIQRAFLILGMSCFTDKIRHKILQEYDNESLMQDEVTQQLIALMRKHDVEIDDIDF